MMLLGSLIGGTMIFLWWKSFKISGKDVDSVEVNLLQVYQSIGRSGILKREEDGFTYVDVNDDFIWRGIEVIKVIGFKEPHYFGEGGVGAHITVIDTLDGKTVDISDIQGMKIDFTFEEFVTVITGTREYFVMVVRADILHQIIEEKGLKKIKHPFHITIGCRERKVNK